MPCAWTTTTEFGSIRCGGAHRCHNAGVLNFAYCSSVNSVVYYMPWVYSSVVSAERLVGSSRWALPWVCGALTFGMCGIYEMQGPNMRWWKVQRDSRILKAEPIPFSRLC